MTAPAASVALDTVPTAGEQPLPGRCGAKTHQRQGGFCQMRPVDGATRCIFHGGKTPKGLQSKHTKSLAKYAGKDLPPQLANRLLAALDDPELLALDRDIALVRGRIGQLFEKFPTAESAEAWGVVTSQLTLYGDLLAQVEKHTPPLDPDLREKLRDVHGALSEAVALARSERALWQEVFDAQAHMQKLIDSDVKRQVSLETLVTAKQGQMLFGALLATIIEEVPDPDVKRRILDRLRNLLQAGKPAGAPAP